MLPQSEDLLVGCKGITSATWTLQLCAVLDADYRKLEARAVSCTSSPLVHEFSNGVGCERVRGSTIVHSSSDRSYGSLSDCQGRHLTQDRQSPNVPVVACQSMC